jgi:uncharacterized protein YuzE
MKRKPIKFEYDAESDAAYLRLRAGKIVESEEVEPGLIVDFGPDEQIVGVEILRFAKRFQRAPRPPKKLAG